MRQMNDGMGAGRGAWSRAAGLTLALAAFTAMPAQAQEADLPVEQVEEIVREYLLREPEIIYQALEELQRRQAADQAEQQKEMLVSRRDEIENDPATPVAGNPDGDVALVEFFDYRCGFCRRVFPAMQALMDEDQNLKVVFKELPVLGEDSVRAARAALASRMQDENLYLDFHVVLMAADDLSAGGIRTLAADVGLDPDQLEQDMESDEISKAIDANYQLASALGIEGTSSSVTTSFPVPSTSRG